MTRKMWLSAAVFGVALAGTFIFPLLPGLVDPKQVTLISLGLGALIATSVLMLWLRPPLVAPMQEGRRLAEGVGWAMILPQLLASLGALFTVAGVGEIVGALAPMANATIFPTIQVPSLPLRASKAGPWWKP